MLTKGQVIGVSGATGNVTGRHLHVHVKPFDDESGMPNREFVPENATDKETREQLYPPLATRISGCMNFACFLPADGTLPAIAADGLLLSARDSDARIPVYMDAGGTTSVDTIDGSKIGCYTVTDRATVGGSTWYAVQFSAGRRWVSKTGMVGTHPDPVQWVRVENTMPVADPAVSTNAVGTAVRSTPSAAATRIG